MLPLIVRRVGILIPMLLLMSVLSFAIMLAPPGDFVDEYARDLSWSGGIAIDKGQIENLRAQFGLDEPVYKQYLKWLWNVLQGNLGFSLEFQRPVNELIGERLALTLVLALFTVMFTWTLAIPIGIISAVKQYSIIDHASTFLSYLGVGTPNFLLALVIMWFVFDIFGLKITGLFSQEYQDAEWSIGKFIDMLKHIWVPMLILGTDGTARFVRIVRANLLDELSKP